MTIERTERIIVNFGWVIILPGGWIFGWDGLFGLLAFVYSLLWIKGGITEAVARGIKKGLKSNNKTGI